MERLSNGPSRAMLSQFPSGDKRVHIIFKLYTSSQSSLFRLKISVVFSYPVDSFLFAFFQMVQISYITFINIPV